MNLTVAGPARLGPGTEGERSFLGLKGYIIEYLECKARQSLAEIGKLQVQFTGEHLGEKLKHYQQPDYPEYKIKDYSEDYDKQAPYPNIDIFDVFFYIGIHLILPLK